MRSRRNMPAPRAVTLTAGALILAVPGSAVALSATNALAQDSAPAPAGVPAHVSAHSVAYGSEVALDGTLPAGDAGEGVVLEFKSAGANSWRTAGRSTVGHDGDYRVRGRLPRSGMVRVALSGTPRGVSNATRTSGVPAAHGSQEGGASFVPSAPEYVAVESSFKLAPLPGGGIAGQTVHVHGRLLPAAAGQTVRLMTRDGRRLRTLASGRTGRRGGFDISYVVPASGSEPLRVSFSGDRISAAKWAGAGTLKAMHESVASWYDDAGNTACGFHATYGVANKTLPCGTKVTFMYGGRSVVATVDDRGPFVPGRDYDLNQNTAAALGMGGVETVLSSI
jgi:peptidoglycan lytic transglycosylase